jgi:hypothetical protein
VNPETHKVSVGLDFTFNSLRNVHRVGWKVEESVPWYREVTDGMTWFSYCKNKECQAFKQMFVTSRGYGIFKMTRDFNEIQCPLCLKKELEVRNVGFVNCDWALKGKLNFKSESRVYGEGQTYDGKLYTFKETNFAKVFE